MLKFSKNKIGKRAFSAFLCAVLSFSNVQGVAYAGELVGEELSAGAEHSTGGERSSEKDGSAQGEERGSEGQGSSAGENSLEKSEEGSSSLEGAEEGKQGKTAVEGASSESLRLQEDSEGNPEENSKVTEESDGEEEAKEASETSLQLENTAAGEAAEESDASLPNEEEKQELNYLEEGAFTESTADGILVTAKFGEDTFPEGTYMKLQPVEEEEILSAMKEKVKSEKEKSLAEGEEVDIRSAYVVDISFYRLNADGKEIEVQPKKGKSVEVQLKKNSALEEALSLKPGVWVEEYVDEEEIHKEKQLFQKDEFSISLPENEELSLVHLPEGKAPELVALKDSEEAVSFKGRHFSPYGVVASATASSDDEKSNHIFRGFWREAQDPKAGQAFAETGHSYTDVTDGDIRKQKHLLITPPEKNSNRLDKSTLVVEFTLKGNKDTRYPVGSVTMDIPASAFESWNPEHPTTVAYNGSAITEYAPVKSGIPEAPKTNTLSDFNFTFVEKTIDGKKVQYYRLKNHSPLPGGMTFSADFEYSMVPSMIKVEHKNIDGEEVGEYSRSLPIYAKVDHPDDRYDAEVEDDLSLMLRTKVNPLKMQIKHGVSGAKGGIYYNWDPVWGEKPADADDYFYVPWFIDVERAKGSSQGFDYKFELNQNTPDGGELIGAQKAYQSYDWNSYTFSYNLNSYTQSANYTDITTYMNKKVEGDLLWKTNPIGRSFIGIDKEPIKTGESREKDVTRERGSNTEYNSNSFNGTYNYQRYVALYRYPMSKITEALKQPDVDPTKPLFTLKNSVSWTETWADGYVRTGSAESSLQELAKIILPQKLGGNIVLDKNNGGYSRYVSALQSIIADGGTDLPMDGYNRNNSFYMYANFQADGNSVSFKSDGSYTVPESKAVLRDDGEYYLYTLKSYGAAESINSNWSTPLNTETLFKEQGTPVYKLTEEDFYYDAVSISLLENYDVEKANGPAGYTPTGKVRTDFSGYKPIELWIRKKGSSSYEKYGTFQAVDSHKFSFTPEPGYTVETPNNNAQAITDYNYIDLEKSFPERIAGLEFRTASDAYQTNLKTRFGIKLTPTKEMRKEFQKALTLGDSGKYNFIGGPGYGKVESGSREVESRLGKSWSYVGYRYDPLTLSSYIYKNMNSYVDSPATSEQLINTTVQISNESSIPKEYREDKYVGPYLIREGIIYDLLPAGTYVDTREIALGPNASAYSSLTNFQQGKDYLVEMIPNWQNSGQTMMKISFQTPKGSQTLDWKNNGRSALRLYYVVHNPYTNIVDRGTIHQNTVAFLNTSKESKWIPNFNPADKEQNIPARKTGKLKEPYFQSIMEEAWNSDESHYKTMSIADATASFGPITVLQAAFTNTVSTEIHKPFLKENVSYMGDPYQHRLMYQAESVTRTTDTVIFDILGEDKDRNGDFAGIDISSMMNKRSFKKGLSTENPDTLEPEVYYATVIPSKAQRDLGAPKYDAAAYANDTNPNNPKNPGSIWKKWDVKNPENNAGIDKSKIKAIAIDARTTKAGERFILDYQGLLIAYVQMTATKDMDKVSVRNTNQAYRTGVMFQGDDIPTSAIPVDLEAPSYHNIIEPVVFTIPVKKVMAVEEGLRSPDIKNAFKFTLKAESGASLLDEVDQPVVTEMTNPDADGGLMEFGKIRILRPGTYTYSVTESGNRPGIMNDALAEKTVTITVTNPDNKKMTYSSSLGENQPLVFTNSYGVGEVFTDITVKKVLEHYGGVSVPDISEKFTFTLTALDDAPMPQEAGSNTSLSYTNPDKDGGEIVFGPIPYTKPGEYKYTITEDGSVESIQNDPVETKNITVTVKDMGDGTLTAAVSGEGQEFRNVLSLKPVEAELSLRKEIKGEKPEKDDQFSFTMVWKKTELSEGGNAGKKLPTDLAPMPGQLKQKEVQGSVMGEGSLAFEKISFPAPGKYTYEVTEDVLPISGYSFDDSVYTVVFTVEEDPANPLQLTVNREIFKKGSVAEEVLFVNRFGTPVRPSGGGVTPSRPVTPGGHPDRPTPSTPQEESYGEVLGEERLQDSAEETEHKEGEVLGEERMQESRATKTGDNSALSLYGIFAGLSAMLLGLYMALKKRFSG